jgi:hypothetical protein
MTTLVVGRWRCPNGHPNGKADAEGGEIGDNVSRSDDGASTKEDRLCFRSTTHVDGTCGMGHDFR